MKKQYVSFSKKKFEYELFQMKKKLKFSTYLNITDDLIRNNIHTKEYVYLIRTGRKDTNILIYSSVDTRIDRMRELGTDAVRVVLVRKRSDGERFYKKVKTHQRINTLFNNLTKSVELALEEAVKYSWFKNSDKTYQIKGM